MLLLRRIGVGCVVVARGLSSRAGFAGVLGLSRRGRGVGGVGVRRREESKLRRVWGNVVLRGSEIGGFL